MAVEAGGWGCGGRSNSATREVDHGGPLGNIPTNNHEGTLGNITTNDHEEPLGNIPTNDHEEPLGNILTNDHEGPLGNITTKTSWEDIEIFKQTFTKDLSDIF